MTFVIARVREMAAETRETWHAVRALPHVIATQRDVQTQLNDLDRDLGQVEASVAEFNTRPVVRSRA